METYAIAAALGIFGSLILSLFLLAKGRVELWILVSFLVVVAMLIYHDETANVTEQGVNLATG